MAVVQNCMSTDPLLIDKIVYELKSQGIFDQFRKECIADVDTKPAYQNLRQRVEGSVSGFLSKQKWSSDLNKNQLREMLRKNIYESGFLETGVERIVDQVVNPKINSIFLPKVTEVVYKFLGIEKPSADKKENFKQTFDSSNLLPTDLEAVSPESDKKFDVSNDSQNLDDSKIDEDESPPFEPLEEKPAYVPAEENSVDSHLSGFSGLMSHDSNHSQEFSKPTPMEVSNQDSLFSKQSSDGHLSIVMSDDNDTKMEICEDLQHQKVPKTNDLKAKSVDSILEVSQKTTNSSKKTDEKIKNDRCSKSHDKHRSRHDSKSERKNDKDKKSDKDRKDHKDRHSSRDKGKEKDRKDSKNGNGKSDKSENKSDKDTKHDKDRSKSSSSSSNNRHSSSSKEKSSSSKREHSSSSKDRGDHKDKSKSSSSKDKDSKHKEEKSKSDSKSSSKHESRSDKHRKDDKHKSSRHSSSSKSRDKDKKDSKKDKKESKDDHFSSKKKTDRRSTDRDSNDGHSGLKSSSSSFESYTSSQNQNKSQESSNSNSNTGSGSGDSGNSDVIEQASIECAPMNTSNEETQENKKPTFTLNSKLNHLPGLKLIKPKFASNIHEARRLMKIRKQLSILEKQSILDLTQMINKKIIENKLKSANNNKEVKSDSTEKLQQTNNKTAVLRVNAMAERNLNNKVGHKSRKSHNNNNKLKHKVNNKTKNLNKNKPVPKNNCVIVSATSPEKSEIEIVSPETLSPPLKSSVVSAATWDALEAKLHQSLNYSTSYEDVPENVVESTNLNKDDCLYLQPDPENSRSWRYLQFSSRYIKTLEDGIEKHSSEKVTSELHLHVNLNKVNKGVKRKYSEYQSDLKNNNKKFNTHHIEVHENFSLPLSPAESENSIDKKSDTSESSIKSTKKNTTEFIEKVKKTVRAPAKTQRYSSEDLYKPRPFFSGSRRRTGRNIGID